MVRLGFLHIKIERLSQILKGFCEGDRLALNRKQAPFVPSKGFLHHECPFFSLIIISESSWAVSDVHRI